MFTWCMDIYYFNKEFKIENKYVLYSLPVKKETIVYFRFLFSFIMFFICLGLWFFNGYFFDVVWNEHLTYFDEIYHSKVIFIALLFYIIQQSLFLPTVFVFNMTGIVISFVIGLSIAIASVPLIFYPYSYRYSYYFHQQDIGLIIFLSIIMIVLVSSSIYVSRTISHKYDL